MFMEEFILGGKKKLLAKINLEPIKFGDGIYRLWSTIQIENWKLEKSFKISH